MKKIFCLLLTLSLLCMGEEAVFYGRMFAWYGWGSLLLPALTALLPALVFALGSGWLLGRLQPWLVYVWMAVPFLLAALPLPEALSLWNGSFFTAYPLTLGTLDPAFVLPIGAVAAQAALLALGAALLEREEGGKVNRGERLLWELYTGENRKPCR